MSTFNFIGRSGAEYTYSLVVPETKNMSRQPGLFIFASGGANNPTPVLISTAENLKESLSELFVTGGLWDQANGIHDVKLLYVHIGERVPRRRDAEKEDLEKRYQPAMNYRAPPV
jgi:hypothetical protein